MFSICPRLIDDSDYDLLQLADLTRRPSFNFIGDPRELMLLRNLPSGLHNSEIQNTDKEFRIRLDLQHFKPEEVKIASDNKCVTITASHEEKQDKHGYVTRKLTRVYTLPEDVDPKSVTSAMNSQGVLSVKAAKQALEAPKETVIPVEFKN